jgi:hypothetical protein
MDDTLTWLSCRLGVASCQITLTHLFACFARPEGHHTGLHVAPILIARRVDMKPVSVLWCSTLLLLCAGAGVTAAASLPDSGDTGTGHVLTPSRPKSVSISEPRASHASSNINSAEDRPPPPPPPGSGRLCAVGGTLVDGTGRAVALRGVNAVEKQFPWIPSVGYVAPSACRVRLVTWTILAAIS